MRSVPSALLGVFFLIAASSSWGMGSSHSHANAPALQPPLWVPIEASAALPQVISLERGALLPASVVLSESPNRLAESLVARLAKEAPTHLPEPTTIGINTYDFFKDSEIQMAFSESSFHSIRTGCFRNQHQTLYSAGTNNKMRRQDAENRLLGLSLEKRYSNSSHAKIHRIRAKYAYLVPTREMIGVTPHQYATQYGGIFAVFKNDVKLRSTFTATDSLMTPGAQNYVFGLYADYTQLRSGYKDYWETQIWGDLCFSDVAYFLVNCPGQTTVSAPVLNEMRQTGIPIYACSKEKHGVNEIYVQADLLMSENTELRKTDEALASY